MEQEPSKPQQDPVLNEEELTSEAPDTPPQPPEEPPTEPETPPMQPMGKKKPKLLMIIAAAAVVLLGSVLAFMMLKNTTDSADKEKEQASDKTTLVYAVHWLEAAQVDGTDDENGKVITKGLKDYLDEYTALHPGIEFAVQQIEYGEYANKLKVLNDSGAAPDIFQAYSQWGVDYVNSGILDEPPAEVAKDVTDNYISTAGVTIDGKIWGIPTEINNFALLYNKDMFKAAGIVDSKGNASPPKTWDELVADAKKLTKKNGNTITQYGFSFLRDNDWQAVDPFLSLLFSNGGEYLSKDLTKSLVNSSAGVEALDAELQLFKNGSTDELGNFFDFGEGKVAMVISPPWTKGGFATAFGDKFEDKVGVAPLPYLEKPATLQYSWFTGVMKESQNKQAAWDFLKWFSSELQPETGTTRYGDLLANTIGAIPARKVDFENHAVLNDFFTGVFVDQMDLSVAEPNVLQNAAIKAELMKQIQAAWDGTKTSQQALDAASTAINKILQSNQ